MLTGRQARVAAVLAAVTAMCVACGTSSASFSPSTTNPTNHAATSSPPGTVVAADGVPVGSLPLGDGHLSLTSAHSGDVFSCQAPATTVRPLDSNTPWIDTTSKTWTPSAKPTVQGAITWPQATYAATVSGGTRTVTAMDVPVKDTTGVFPIASSDPAYAYDHNPNHISPHAVTLTLPADPTAASSPGCLPMGPIGITVNGVWLFNALDASGLDAAAHEVQDSCGGHPDAKSDYHYHDVPPCLLAAATGSSTLIGYALDGYGIYVQRNPDGTLPTDANLDACHGTTSPVLWDGKVVTMYHYVATAEYPYTVGCFHGVVTSTAAAGAGHTSRQLQPGNPAPPGAGPGQRP